MDDPANAPDRLLAARRALRGSTKGVLRVDGRPEPVRFTHDGRDGRLILSLTHESRGAEECVLFMPDEGFGAAEALLQLHDLPERDWGAQDRYQAYHGAPDTPVWTLATVVTVREGPDVFDGEDLARPNPLREHEPALLRAWNADRDLLTRIGRRELGIDLNETVALGVDDLGFDLRASLGPVRVEWAEPCETREACETAFRVLVDR